MKHKSLIVMRKELRETLRDRRSVFLFAFLIALYPFMLWTMLNQLIAKADAPDRETTEVVVVGSTHVPTLVTQLEQKNIVVKSEPDMNDEQITALLAKHKIASVIKIAPDFDENYADLRPARIELWFDSAADLQAKQKHVAEVLRNYSNGIASARLLAHGVSPATLFPIHLQDYDTASSASRSARFIGSIMGMMFMFAFMFCLNAVMDMTAGERERRSLEILMTQPVRPRDLIIGKWLAATVISFVGVSCELIVMHFLLKQLPLEEIGMSWRLSLLTLLLVCGCTLTLSMLAAAFEIALALNARTFKEAQTMMSFAIMLPMLPVIAVPMLDLQTADWMYAVPILAHQTLLTELAKGSELGWLPVVLTVGVSFSLAVVGLCFASWRLGSEKYVINV